MSKSTITGLAAAVMVIISAFLPWLTVESRHLVFTGLHTAGSNFGEPGWMNIIVSVMAGLLFIVQKQWAQRVNVFMTGFLIAWTFRNFILFARCEMGECTHKEIVLYLWLIGAIIAFICVIATPKSR